MALYDNETLHKNKYMNSKVFYNDMSICMQYFHLKTYAHNHQAHFNHVSSFLKHMKLSSRNSLGEEYFLEHNCFRLIVQGVYTYMKIGVRFNVYKGSYKYVLKDLDHYCRSTNRDSRVLLSSK